MQVGTDEPAVRRPKEKGRQWFSNRRDTGVFCRHNSISGQVVSDLRMTTGPGMSDEYKSEAVRWGHNSK